MKLFKNERWIKFKGESDARVDYFQNTHFYASDLDKEKANKTHEFRVKAEIKEEENRWSVQKI